MNREQVIKKTGEFVRQNMKYHDSSHDWWHIERVRCLAKFINDREKIADPYILEISALLHDVADLKFSENSENLYSAIAEFLKNIKQSGILGQVMHVIRNVSYSNKNHAGDLANPVLLVLQDADRLDAMGAIGIARAFNYGGFRNNPIYVPDALLKDCISSIDHFYAKLLKLKDMMNTPTAMNLAIERHSFMEKYLEQFYNELTFNHTITGKTNLSET